MSASGMDMTSSGGATFWERLWRLSGINFILFFIVANVIYGAQPELGASADALAAFYNADRKQVLIAAVISGMAVLNLLWFAAAIRATLAEAGRDGWGAAVTTAAALLGGMFLLLLTVSAALAYSIAGSGDQALTSGLNDLAWALTVLTSFPRAMLIMAGTFGLWRAGLISKALFSAGVAALLLVLLGAVAWQSNGFWAPDGAYTRFVSPAIGFVWIVVVSWVLLNRTPATGKAW